MVAVMSRTSESFLNWTEIEREVPRHFGINFSKKFFILKSVWCNKLKQDREWIDNESHPHPVTEENTAHAFVLAAQDRLFMVHEISEKAGIWHGSALSIITMKLCVRKISALWIPRLLGNDYKAARFRVSQLIQACF